MTIARSFLATTTGGALSPSVVLVTDECNGAVMRAAVRAAGLEENSRLTVDTFPPEAQWTSADAERFQALNGRAATVKSQADAATALRCISYFF